MGVLSLTSELPGARMLALCLLLLSVQSLSGHFLDLKSQDVVIKPRDFPVQSLRMTSDDDDMDDDDDDYFDDDDSLDDDDISDVQGDRSLFKAERQVDALPCKGKDNLKFGEMTAIETPGYPSNYPDRRKCSWKIRIPANSQVTVYCEYFNLVKGKRDGDSQNCGNHETFCSFDGVQNMLTPAYLSMAYASQPASVAPAGEAWRAYPDRNSLFAGDGSHATASGTYLTALTMLETIWPGVSGVGNSYSPVSNARLLQDIAHMTMLTRNWSYPEDGDHPCNTMTCLG